MSSSTLEARPLAAPGRTYDVFAPDCPTRLLLDELADKWVCLVLAVLADGPRRHAELRRAILGVSQKMLTQTLRSLERDGIVSRAVTASVPPRVDYALTPLGLSLMPVVRELTHWAQAHMPEVEAARTAYDEQR